jgi:Tfp pilus assembly protein PilZ
MTMAADSEDRRFDERVNAKAEIDFSDGERFYKGYLFDISQGGVQIEASRPVEPGTKLTLAVPLLKSPLKIHGFVRWSR